MTHKRWGWGGLAMVAALGTLSAAPGFLGLSGMEPVNGKEHAELGLAPDQAGLRIEEVMPDGPAAAAGLQAGDVILLTNAEEVAKPELFAKRVRQTGSGNPLALSFLRDGKKQEMTVTLGAPPAQPKMGGIEGKKAPPWNVAQWKNLPEGKERLEVSDLAGKAVYLYCFQSW